MLKHIGIIILLGVFVFACNGSNNRKKPDNLISKNQMSDLLYDLYLINGAKGVNRKLLEKNGLNPEKYILEKYNIDSAQFANSNTYYAFDTETYKAIVDKVKARLEKEKEAFEVIKEREEDSIQKRKDSIREQREKLRDSLKSSDSLALKIDSLDFKEFKPKSTRAKNRIAKDLLKIVDSLR
ncbi:MAG: DUF4296 domain-containing protein [Winogradskyella sp.]|uniref:DUF4296 domain-containing protein n=1 Tax=Winogradskyella sp. TaxID=1883156 RepID=UPI00385B646C